VAELAGVADRADGLHLPAEDVAAKYRPGCRMSTLPACAKLSPVIWCTTTSGRAAATAALTPGRVQPVHHDGLGAELAGLVLGRVGSGGRNGRDRPPVLLAVISERATGNLQLG
jgi:hypothetical protein